MSETTTQLIESTMPFSDHGSAVLQPLSVANDDRTSDEIVENVVHITKLRKTIVVLHQAGVNFTCSAVNGLVTVGLPAITADLGLSPSLAFWPASVSGLATASTLLLAGSIADVVGPRSVDLVGCFASGALMVGAGASRRGADLVGIRALQGVGQALHFASSVAIVAQIFPRGRGRNIAFSVLGLSQPLGFSFGLVLGGILVDTLGWRNGWFLYGGITLLLSAAGLWALPANRHDTSFKGIAKKLRDTVDWVGAGLASTFMALLCYFFAVISSDIKNIHDAGSLVPLCLSAVALPCFAAWVHRQVRLDKPALIPNQLWMKPAFASICATITLSFAFINSMELFTSLFFQEVQHLSALQASIRILPSVVVGIILNFTTGLFVDKVPALWIVVVSSVLSAVAPLLMAVVQPQWTYWANAFLAQVLMPISCDALFTVGLIIITDMFPDDTQALAGGVFNTASQFGGAVGLAIMQIISTLVTKDNHTMGETRALLAGYKASFWAMFGFMLLCGVVGAMGLRKTGRVGLKRD